MPLLLAAFLILLLIVWFQERNKDIQKKRAACNHYHTKIVTYYSYDTEICEDCGHQEPIYKNDIDGVE